MMLNAKSIGNKIAEVRKKNNLSQAELAQKVSISPQAVGKWERGESLPDITTLHRLAELFHVDLNYFGNFTSTEEKQHELSSKKDDTLVTKIKDNLGMRWNLSGESYADIDFSGIKNIKEKLSGSSFKNCKLIESDLSDIHFKGNSIRGCDFSTSDLRNCHFYGSDVRENSFQQTLLIDALFTGSTIRNCDFTNADLSGIEIKSSSFRDNSIDNTKWSHATFTDSSLNGISFTGIIEDCSFSGCGFTKVSFKNTIIKNSFFKYCDLKRVEFIDCKADKITYAFLKSNKANLSTITLIE